MWFEKLTGFRETTLKEVRSKLKVEGTRMTSLVNGRTFACGTLETPSLGELRDHVAKLRLTGRSTLAEELGDVQDLHQAKENEDALFQVASQFNLLEMVGPNVTPERGVDMYEMDHTQGPACAIAAGAGTIFRNYFVEVNGQVGQSENNQIDCLHDLGRELGNETGKLWRMKNGYALATEEGLAAIERTLREATPTERDHLRDLLRIGVHSGVEVTLNNCGHTVSQAYCSALPVAYSPGISPERWEASARLVLEGAYEATVYAAALNRVQTGNPRLFLTLLGGGAFGNLNEWIFPAMQRALELARDFGLEIYVVSRRSSNPLVQQLVESFQRR